ncbi:transposase [Bacillus sp. HNG]|nr:transposase [Bacillus sp. HNG]
MSEETIKYIHAIRSSEPARRVGSNGKNVHGTYPSKKMGKSIQFESHHLELAGIYEKEFDPEVYEYYDQPPSFKINYKFKNGKNGGSMYTADFFVISENFIGWEEWKTEEELIKLSIENSSRYLLDENNVWRCPPQEKFAEKHNLSFRVRSSKDLNQKYIRNIRFLEDYLLSEQLEIKGEEEILTVIRKNEGVSINEILEHENNFNADLIYSLIVTGIIYVDINNEVIPDFSACLYSNRAIKEAYQNLIHSQYDLKVNTSNKFKVQTGENIIWDEVVWEILNLGKSDIYLMSEEKNTVNIPHNTFNYLILQGKIKGIELEDTSSSKDLDLFKQASPEDLLEANKRFALVSPIIRGELRAEDVATSSEYSLRTLQDWMQKFRNAETEFEYGYVGLLPNHNKKGNRLSRYPQKVIDLMLDYITNKYEDYRQRTARSVYQLFEGECKELGYDPIPSYVTFTQYKNKTPLSVQEEKRKSKKAAYDHSDFTFYLSEDNPRHGDRIFEFCHIDHTLLEIELRCSVTNKNLGRPWATFLSDAYSRRLLAVSLSFDNPGYRSNLMVLRECVRRHGRFPSTVVVDGGRDFRSIYFETFTSKNNCGRKYRPGAKPRYGSVIERLFGTANKSFISSLIGNTQLTKNVRKLTKNTNPKNLSIWTLEEFTKLLEEWAYELYDRTEHSSLGVSPKEMYELSVKKGGNREVTHVAYDETFKFLVLPTTKKGTAKIQPGYGVKINRFYYWDIVFKNGLLENKQVPVKYDPFDAGIAYAFINHNWVMLRSEKYQILKNRSEKEIQIATIELKRRMKLAEDKSEITQKMITDFLVSIEGKEILLTQQLKDRAFRNIYLIEGGKVEKDEVKSGENNQISKNENPGNLKLVVDNSYDDFEEIEFEDFGEL